METGTEKELEEINTETENELYIRNLEDVNGIIKHAKLDAENLTEITQAIYYPSNRNTDNFKLLELDSHLLHQIREGETLEFKGGLNEKVVLCSEDRTYDCKCAQISNSLLLVPDFKFAAATSSSPLRSPRNLNSNNAPVEPKDVSTERSLEHCKVLHIFHDYIECREIKPRFRKLYDLLQLTRYSGPEHEELTDHRLLFTYEQLLDTIQCSKSQFEDGLQQYKAIEIGGFVRILKPDYEYRIVSLMLGVVCENSWNIDEVERTETVELLEGIAPVDILCGLFDLYTSPTPGQDGKYTYNEELVARIVAHNILQPGLKFKYDEFFTAWQDSLLEGMKCDEKYIRGLGIIDTSSSIPCVRSLAEEDLPMNIHERFQILFKTKAKWTQDEMEPYISCFSTPVLSISSLLAKYARTLTENGVRYYVSKH